MLNKHPTVFFLQNDPFSWHPGVRPRVSGSLGKSVPCVLALYSTIGHKELILPINEISTTDGDVLTIIFKTNIFTLMVRPMGSKDLEAPERTFVPHAARDTEVIHGGQDVGHSLKGRLSPPGAMEAGLGCMC